MWYPRAFFKWCSLALSLTVCNAFAADEARCLPGYIYDDDIDECVADTAEEEIIVTGSFIRRDNFDLPSPMNVIDELELEMAGTPTLATCCLTKPSRLGSTQTPLRSNSVVVMIRTGSKAGKYGPTCVVSGPGQRGKHNLKVLWK